MELLFELKDYTVETFTLPLLEVWRLLQDKKRVASIHWALTPYNEAVARVVTIGGKRGSNVHYINRVDDELLECVDAQGVAFTWVKDYWTKSYYSTGNNNFNRIATLLLFSFRFSRNLSPVEDLRIIHFDKGKFK